VKAGALVVHPGALGDVLQAVPALRAVRAALDGGAITFAGQPRLGRLLADWGLVQRTRAFDGLGLEALFTDEPAPPALADALGGFDRVISWFGSREETYRRRLRALAPGAIVAPPVPEDDGPVWRHLLGTVAEPEVMPSWVEPVRLSPAPATGSSLPSPLRGEGRGRGPSLVVHPGSGGEWKRWPVERFAAVIETLRHRHTLEVVVHQGPADAEAAQALLARLGDGVGTLLEPDLPRLAATLAAARAYLGGDSGVSHLAAAVGAPSVILFPPATRRRWAPWSPSAVAVEVTGEAREVERVAGEVARRLATSQRRGFISR
jgi:ADP-heptose:LPS heptosyltransferase